MAELASAERNGPRGRVHRVTVYQYENCRRFIALGKSADPHWVSPKAQMFLDRRTEAFRLARLTAPPAVVIFDIRRRLVLFG
jgi:hypothetical protein